MRWRSVHCALAVLMAYRSYKSGFRNVADGVFVNWSFVEIYSLKSRVRKLPVFLLKEVLIREYLFKIGEALHPLKIKNNDGFHLALR